MIKRCYKPIHQRLALFSVLLLFFYGCAGEKAAQKDPFEKWQTTAESSMGHSPATKEKTFQILDEQQAIGKEAEEVSPEPIRPLPSTTVTLKMKKIDIKTVLRTLARAAGINIIFKEDMKGEVDFDFVDLPWDQVFKGILRSQGLTYAWDGNILRVMTAEEMELDIKVSALREKRQSQDISVRLMGPLTTVLARIDYADVHKLKETLETFLLKDKDGKTIGSIRVEEHNNALIIQATRDDIRRMMDIIKKIDRGTSQILIKANIVETTKETARNLGIQWGGMYGTRAGGGSLFVTPGGTGGTTGTNPTGGAYTAATGTSGISGQGFGVNLPAAAISDTSAASLGLLFGTLGGNILDIQLSALQKDGKLNILSSPSITTLDNQKAFTENGEKVPYVTTTSSGSTTTQAVQFENAVLRLEITPHVIDGKNLRMKIVVQKDEVDTTRQVSGNPFIIKKQTETLLIVKDGETIVISGLTKQKSNNTDTGIPFLKDIPLLGWLFSGSSKTSSMEEVLIFITPTILPIQAEG